MLVDSHAHLEGPKFDVDRIEMLERARAAGVVNILAIGSGTGPGTLDCAIRIAEQHDWIYASIGIHPHEAKLATQNDYLELESLTQHARVIGFGAPPAAGIMNTGISPRSSALSRESI